MFLSVAGACRTSILKPFSLHCFAMCCTVWRSQWCQSGFNSVGSFALASLVPVHLQDGPTLTLVYFFPFGRSTPCESRATVSVDLNHKTHAG